MVVIGRRAEAKAKQKIHKNIFAKILIDIRMTLTFWFAQILTRKRLTEMAHIYLDECNAHSAIQTYIECLLNE